MKKNFKIALCTFLFFSFASAFYALNANDIYIRPVKVRVVSEETGLPVKGLKVYNTAEIHEPESPVSRLFMIKRVHRYCLLGEYETDENGEAFLEEKWIPAGINVEIKYQEITINAECVDINLPDEEKAYYLQNIPLDEPDVKKYTYTPDKRYKNCKIYYTAGSKDHNSDKKIRYYQEKWIYYENLFDENKKYPKLRSLGNESDEIEIRIKNRPPLPQNGIDIKTGSHKIYSYEKKYEEIGTAVLTRKNDSYNLTLNGKAYTVEEQPYPSYIDVEIPNIVLKMDEINDEVKGRKVLLGDYNGNKIIITKELKVSWLIPESIRKDYREYYYLIIVPEELFKKDFAKPVSSLTYEIKHCYKALYKAIFYEEIDK